MGPYFTALPFLLIPFVPAITMRAWAEERAQHTFELLMTLPLHSLQVVLGKYLAALCFYAIVLAGSLPIVLMLFFLGDPDPRAHLCKLSRRAAAGRFLPVSSACLPPA